MKPTDITPERLARKLADLVDGQDAWDGLWLSASEDGATVGGSFISGQMDPDVVTWSAKITVSRKGGTSHEPGEPDAAVRYCTACHEKWPCVDGKVERIKRFRRAGRPS